MYAYSYIVLKAREARAILDALPAETGPSSMPSAFSIITEINNIMKEWDGIAENAGELFVKAASVLGYF